MDSKDANNQNLTRFYLDSSFQGVKKLFVFAFDNTDGNTNRVERDNHRKYLLPRVNITNYNVLINSKIFYGQPINDQIKKYDEITKYCIRARR